LAPKNFFSTSKDKVSDTKLLPPAFGVIRVASLLKTYL
jgi:hypothetical protein